MEGGIFINSSKYIKEMLKKFELEDSKPTKTSMSTEIKLTKDDEAKSVDSTKYRAISSNPNSRNLDEPPRQNSFTFQKRARPDPQHQALKPSLKLEYKATWQNILKEWKGLKKSVFKQREEIKDRMAKMFRLLKELTTSKTLEKVLVREEARHPITKHVNAISLINMEKEKSVENN
ncbi:hypothetical protein Tco_1569710 [Tanacetum coccineum]